jgi:hypothetical protein
MPETMNETPLMMPEGVQVEAMTPTYGRFVVQPLERGYGVTIGNAFRRVLLSSLPGTAITRVGEFRRQQVGHDGTEVRGIRSECTGVGDGERTDALATHPEASHVQSGGRVFCILRRFHEFRREHGIPRNGAAPQRAPDVEPEADLDGIRGYAKPVDDVTDGRNDLAAFGQAGRNCGEDGEWTRGGRRRVVVH